MNIKSIDNNGCVGYTLSAAEMDVIYKIFIRCGYNLPQHLDNGTVHAENAPWTEGDADMANKSERVTINGKQRWVTGSSQQERFEKAARMMYDAGMFDAQQKNEPVQNEMTFGVYAKNWFDTYKHGKIRHTTEREYQSILKCHLLPAFADISLAEIDTAAIQKMLDTKSGKSKKTVHEILLVLGMILESAMMDKYVSCNHARDKRLSNPATRKMKRKALSVDELADIINHIQELSEPTDRRFLALIAYTGMRRAEAFGLRWTDVDFEHKTIHIHRTITFKGNRPVEGTTKTENGIREIIMPDGLIEILRLHPDTEFVVKDNITSSFVKRMMERINREIDLHGATPHCFRHTWTTMAYHNGVDEKTMQAFGGWGDIATMRDIYTHVQDSDKLKAGQTMNKFFDEIKNKVEA